MAADSFIEEVVFAANSAQITAAIADVTKQFEDLRKRKEAVNAALSDPAAQQAMAELYRLGRAADMHSARLLAESHLTARLAAVRNGDYLRGYKEEIRLKQRLREVEQAEAAARPPAQAQSAVAAARERLRLAKEEAEQTLRRMRADREARYGHLGGRLVGFAESRAAGLASWAAAGAGGAVQAAAYQGFSGTVEYERLSREMTLLKRSVAGAFVPAVEMATAGVKRLTRASDSLTAGQQQALAATTIAVVGLKAASIASNRLLGIGLVEAAVTAGSFGGRMLSGAFGSAAGAAGGQAAGSAAFGSAAGAAGGQAAGSAAGKVLAGAGGGAAGGAAASGAGSGAMAAAGPFAAAAAVALGYGKVLYDTGDYYRYMREERGRSRFPSAAFAMGASIWDNLAGIPNFFGAGLPTVDQKLLGKKPADRTDVTLNQSGFGDLGSSYDRFTLAAGQVDDSFQRNMERVANATERMADGMDRGEAPRKE